ncbi:MAG: ABC-type uncharacterized transport system ATPase subunit [Alphaproteobacteria bacterium]|jgi:ABC-type uncharacterized transport system ATPase subunit
MELEKVKIEKFKSILKLELELSSINYLVGGNNAGKSSTLQAIHTAVTAAQTSTELKSKILGDKFIKYCPTGNFADIGYNGPLGNMASGKRSIVSFYGKNDNEDDVSYAIELYKGRNSGAGVEKSAVAVGFSNHIVKSNHHFSIYVPGLAGIPHYEEYRSPANVIRKIAGGEANSVLRNVLLLIKKKGQLDTLKSYMKNVFPDFNITVLFDEKKDQYIEVKGSVKKGGKLMPIDLVGTGVLQALQLFSYVICFEPVLLLLDEPDSHLHPSNQELLIKTFEFISEVTKTKIILATHSRHMINNLPDGAKLFWLEKGKLKLDEDFDRIKLLNDLGALDHSDELTKDLVILTEDKDKKLLAKLLNQIDTPVDRIGIVSYNGISNYRIALHLARELLNDNQKVIVHRDRDFLTETEVQSWEEIVKNNQAIPYTTEGSDLEMCFLNIEHLADISGRSVSDVQGYVESIIEGNSIEWRKKFSMKRQDCIRREYPNGGSPATSDLCPDDAPLGFEHVVGKLLLKKIRSGSLSDFNVQIEPTDNSECRSLAPTLKGIVDQVFSQ